MKDHIGKNVLIRVQGDSVQGKLIADQRDRIIVQEDENIITIAKKHIGFFMVRGRSCVVSKSGLDVLSVVDGFGKEMEVYYVTDGTSLKKNIELFRKAVGLGPANKIENLGDLFSVEQSKLKKILGGMIFGELENGE